MSDNGHQRFSFRGFVALADILFALSACLLLLSPLNYGLSRENDGLSQETSLDNLTAINVLLVKNRVVPVTIGENFVARLEGGRFIASRVKEGETVGDALKPGGLVDTLVMNADPKKQYFRLFVCDDSIPAFRSLVEVLTKRRLAFSWDTAIDSPFLLGNAGPSVNPQGYRPPGEAK